MVPWSVPMTVTEAAAQGTLVAKREDPQRPTGMTVPGVVTTREQTRVLAGQMRLGIPADLLSLHLQALGVETLMKDDG